MPPMHSSRSATPSPDEGDASPSPGSHGGRAQSEQSDDGSSAAYAASSDESEEAEEYVGSDPRSARVRSIIFRGHSGESSFLKRRAEEPEEPTPSKRSRQQSTTPKKPERGPEREIPCLGCISAAVAGKGENGHCYSVIGGRSARCFACKKTSHTCKQLPSVMVPLAIRLQRAHRDEDTKMYERVRLALRLHMDLLDEEDCVFSADEGPKTSFEQELGSKLVSLFKEVQDHVLAAPEQ